MSRIVLSCVFLVAFAAASLTDWSCYKSGTCTNPPDAKYSYRCGGGAWSNDAACCNIPNEVSQSQGSCGSNNWTCSYYDIPNSTFRLLEFVCGSGGGGGGGCDDGCEDCNGECARCYTDPDTGCDICYQDNCSEGCDPECGDCEYCQGDTCMTDEGCGYGPILVDIDGDGYAMTDPANGVLFDMKGDGRLKKLSWTAAGANDAWLALDLNGNGRIDNGKELFGENAYLPGGGQAANGFAALAAYDLPQNGGNGDGVIDVHDAIYYRLLLWVDGNHNGVSEAGELSTLAQRGLASINLRYRRYRFVDQYGNIFRYRARLTDSKDARFGKWAYDVLLQPEGETSGSRVRRAAPPKRRF